MTIRDLALAALLAAVFVIAAVLGLPEWLGAHPFWAVRTGIVGTAIGFTGLVLLRWFGLQTRVLIALSGAGFVLATIAAEFGKRAFVASFAENAVAGRFWFLGWFAIAASLYIFVAALLLARRR